MKNNILTCIVTYRLLYPLTLLFKMQTMFLELAMLNNNTLITGI